MMGRSADIKVLFVQYPGNHLIHWLNPNPSYTWHLRPHLVNNNAIHDSFLVHNLRKLSKSWLNAIFAKRTSQSLFTTIFGSLSNVTFH